MMTCRQAIRVSEGRSLRRDAHSCPRSTDHRASRPRHRVDYGYNSVQEIRSGTDLSSVRIKQGEWLNILFD